MKPISTSRSTFAFSTSLLLLALFTALPAYAQLELDQNGHVGIGVAPNTHYVLNVSSSDKAPFYSVYNGTNAYRAAFVGWAKPDAGVGIGGEFWGGLMGLRVYATLANSQANSYAQGVYTKATGSLTNVGVYSYADDGAIARSFYAYADDGSMLSEGLYATAKGSPALNYGVRTSAYAEQAGANSYGVYGYAYRTASSGVAYGVYGRVAGPWGSEKYAGFFEGDVEVTGTFTNASDAKFKEAVEALSGTGTLAKVLDLQPKAYRYKQDAVGQRMGFSDGERFGFIAQELEQVFPELVSERMHTLPAVEAPSEPWDGEGPPPEPVIEQAAQEVTYKAVNYVDLIPVLVGAIQEQQAEIAALKEALGKLGVTVE